MTVSSRWRQALAAGLVSAAPVVATAGEPPSAPRPVEVLHGTRKVWPPPTPIVLPSPAPPVAPLPVPPPRVQVDRTPAAPDPVEPPPRVVESRTIILAGYATPHATHGEPSAPWLAPLPAAPAVNAQPAAAPQQPAQPAVVVIREAAAESRPAPPAVEAPRGVTLGGEALFGLGIGVAGLGFGLAGRGRRRAAPAEQPAVTAPPATPPAPVAPAAPPGVLLLGEFDAGVLPTTAEKFELSPTYQLEQQEKKKVEEKNQAAVLEFILSQNLALHDDLTDPDAPPPVALEIDPELDYLAPRVDV